MENRQMDRQEASWLVNLHVRSQMSLSQLSFPSSKRPSIWLSKKQHVQGLPPSFSPALQGAIQTLEHDYLSLKIDTQDRGISKKSVE